jgi:glycine/D-amino acid oxidase-like deaminating enzyme
MNDAAVGIVGAGLAGTLLAEALLAQCPGLRIVVWEGGLPGAATPAAAGLANPLTGKHLTLSPQASQQLEALAAVAQRHPASQPHLWATPFFRPFAHPEEADKWALRAQEPHYAPWVRHEVQAPPLLAAPWGGVWVQGVLACHTPLWVEALQDSLRASGVRFVADRFDPHLLDAARLRVNGVAFSALVFAEGVAALHNPLWPFAPIVPLKGERILVEGEGLPQGYAASRGVYVVPQPDGSWVVGATHERHYAHPNPTPQSCKALLASLAGLCPHAQVRRVLHHRSGLRPTTPNHQPIASPHPHLQGIYLFNGLGTKGLLQGPLLAWQLAACVLRQVDAPGRA